MRSFVGVVVGLGAVLLAVSGVFGAAEWYASRVSLPRYCSDPQAAVALVRRIVTSPEPARADSTRPYVVAAKLLFLVPRRQGEEADAYAARLRDHVAAVCP